MIEVRADGTCVYCGKFVLAGVGHLDCGPEDRTCPRCGLVPATPMGIGHAILCRSRRAEVITDGKVVEK